MNDDDVRLGEVLFEFVPQGNFVKVMAIDPITRTEVVVVGDARAATETLENIAIRKLRYVIRKQRRQEAEKDNRY